MNNNLMEFKEIDEYCNEDEEATMRNYNYDIKTYSKDGREQETYRYLGSKQALVMAYHLKESQRKFMIKKFDGDSYIESGDEKIII